MFDGQVIVGNLKEQYIVSTYYGFNSALIYSTAFRRGRETIKLFSNNKKFINKESKVRLSIGKDDTS